MKIKNTISVILITSTITLGCAKVNVASGSSAVKAPVVSSKESVKSHLDLINVGVLPVGIYIVAPNKKASPHK